MGYDEHWVVFIFFRFNILSAHFAALVLHRLLCILNIQYRHRAWLLKTKGLKNFSSGFGGDEGQGLGQDEACRFKGLLLSHLSQPFGWPFNLATYLPGTCLTTSPVLCLV